MALKISRKLERLDHIPAVIKNNQFTADGFVRSPSGLLVPAYIGSELGFNYPGRLFLNNTFHPRLLSIGIMPFCPFTACGEYLGPNAFDTKRTVEEDRVFWKNFNLLVGPVNYETLIPNTKIMIGITDGSHHVDDGLSAEMAFYAAMGFGPVVAIRSDFRMSENSAAPINPAVRYFTDEGPYNGHFYDGPNAYEDAFKGLEKLAHDILAGRRKINKP